MKYQSQKVALAYFYVAMGLFAIQVLGGLLAGWIYVSPNTLSETLPFNVVRMIHTNALIVWLLLGFFGATYYLIPEEAERDIHSPMLAYVQFWVLPHFRCSRSRTRAVIRLKMKEVRGRLLACCQFVIGAAYESAKARHLKALP